MTLDESALLLDLDDVYWTEDGIISVQIALGALGSLSALILVLRLLHRGEGRVLSDPANDGTSDPLVSVGAGAVAGVPGAAARGSV